jgi:hypothetical protein
VTKSQYPYPPDEFDARRTDGAPVGVHREPRSGWSAAWPFLLVAVVFAGIAIGIVSYLSDDRTPANPPAAVSSQEASGEDPAAEGEGEGAEATPSAEPSAAPSETPAEEVGAEDVAALIEQADTTAPVVVQNASAQAGAVVNGLAGTTAELLIAQGFANIATADYDGAQAPSSNAVRYVGDRAETSAAIAAVLGIPQDNVRPVDSLPQGEIAVVMVTAP